MELPARPSQMNTRLNAQPLPAHRQRPANKFAIRFSPLLPYCNVMADSGLPLLFALKNVADSHVAGKKKSKSSAAADAGEEHMIKPDSAGQQLDTSNWPLLLKVPLLIICVYVFALTCMLDRITTNCLCAPHITLPSRQVGLR
jgi:hypothetical protein